MVKVRNFNESLERSFEKLGRQIEEKRKLPEFQELPEREIVKRSLKSLAPPPPPTSSSSPTKEEESQTVLPTYLQESGESEEVKNEVEALVKMVFSRGLEKALEEARRHSPFVEDAFHDALVDKLLPELKKQGIIK